MSKEETIKEDNVVEIPAVPATNQYVICESCGAELDHFVMTPPVEFIVNSQGQVELTDSEDAIKNKLERYLQRGLPFEVYCPTCKRILKGQVGGDKKQETTQQQQ